MSVSCVSTHLVLCTWLFFFSSSHRFFHINQNQILFDCNLLTSWLSFSSALTRYCVHVCDGLSIYQNHIRIFFFFAFSCGSIHAVHEKHIYIYTTNNMHTNKWTNYPTHTRNSHSTPSENKTTTTTTTFTTITTTTTTTTTIISMYVYKRTHTHIKSEKCAHRVHKNKRTKNTHTHKKKLCECTRCNPWWISAKEAERIKFLW